MVRNSRKTEGSARRHLSIVSGNAMPVPGTVYDLITR